MSKIGPYSIFDNNILCLKPGNELKSQAIYPLAKKAIYLNPLGENTEDIIKWQNVTRLHVTYVHIGFTLHQELTKVKKIHKVPHSCVIVVKRKFHLCVRCLKYVL